MNAIINDMRISILVVFLLGTFGCATPAPVLDLAEKTSANASFLSSQMTHRAQAIQKLAHSRAQNIAHLHGITTKAQAELDVQLLALDKSGDKGVTALYKGLAEFSKKVAQTYQQAEGAEEKRRLRILGTQKTLNVPSKQLGEVAKDLAVLAKSENLQQRLKSMGIFIQDVAKDVEKRQKESEEKQKQAEGDLKKIGTPR